MAETGEMVFKLLLAAVLGGAVGYEREVHEHPAGLRTHILVCMGATLITLVSISFQSPSSDPGRIAAQIVSGIGFLGAGTILRQGSIVRGLTTAASLWGVAGIGMAIGVGGMYLLVAAVATAVMFVTLSTMRVLEPASGKRVLRDLYVEMSARDPQVLGHVLETLTEAGISISSVKSVDVARGRKQAFRMSVMAPSGMEAETLIQRAAELEGVDHFELK